MHRTIALVLLNTVFFAASSTICAGQESPAIWQYLGRRAACLAEDLPKVPDTKEVWEKHRADLTSGLETRLGLPQRVPVRGTVLQFERRTDVLVEQVAYHWAEKAYVSATVIRGRETSGPQPAVVIPSGWLGHHTFRAYREFVLSLARSGLLVLFIDDPRTGRRQAPPAGLYSSAAAAGVPVAGIQVFDALRGLDYLLSRSDVDTGKIGVAGFGAGALQAYMAAALEPRFRFVVAIEGTTTYNALVQQAVAGEAPEDPSVMAGGILGFTDIDRLAASIAPRPILVAGRYGGGKWASIGYSRVRETIGTVYALYDANDQICELRDQSAGEMTPYTDQTIEWLQTSVLPRLGAHDVPVDGGGEPVDPDFSMLRYLQRRLADPHRSAGRVANLSDDRQDWHKVRGETVGWLRAACALDRMTPPADQVVEVRETGTVVTEQLRLGLDTDLHCPAVLVRPAESSSAKRAAVILSHDDRQCAASARIAEAARRLAAAGYWVLVPDHVSVNPQSLQSLADPERPRFYGDEAARLYGPADAVGLSPLALRVADDLAAFRHLTSRTEVDSGRIVIAGLGLGSIDAVAAAAVEARIAGVAAVDVTTIGDWVAQVAPSELHFFHLAPVLPSMPGGIDVDCFCAAIAPRPFAVIERKGGWPESGYQQVVETTSAVYKLLDAEQALLTLGPRDLTEDFENRLSENVQKQLIVAARPLLPTPPQPGIVGTVDGLTSRQTTDSATGLIWLIREMDDYDQEFSGSGYHIESWGFFNDNRGAQQDRVITPLIFREQDDKYVLVGIGKTRTNTGGGLQHHPFEPMEGIIEVGDGYFFGWHTGDREGTHNAGVVEFQDAPDSLVQILTADGQMTGQKLQIGEPYRIQSQFRRRYSIMAVSKK